MKFPFPATARSIQSIQSIRPDGLWRQLQQGGQITLVDVRSAAEFSQLGHIAGARLLPLIVLGQRTAELPRNEPIICICHSGQRSQIACEILHQQGFSQVFNLMGGMVAWAHHALPLEH